MENNNNISNDLVLFTKFLKETYPVIFNEENINRMIGNFEIWKENHTYTKKFDFDFTDMIKKAAAKRN